jgi:hypothetical protein
MAEMVNIVHNNYDKISDLCMWLSNEFILKFTVELNKRSNDNITNFHNEVGYRYNNEYRVNINRDFNYYLSIESVKRLSEDNRKLVIKIGINNIYFFQQALQEISVWFTGDAYKSLFVKKDGSIIIGTHVKPIRITVMYNNYIEFEPSIQSIGIDQQLIGVRVYLNSDGLSFFMSVERLFGLIYFISNFNMYQSAQLMLNYLGRPSNGTNYFGINGASGLEAQDNGFFSKVNATKR